MTSETGEDAAKKELFFSVSITKFVIMSLATLGAYDLYWFYRNWKAVKHLDRRDISPFFRAWFVIFYIVPLFKRMTAAATEKNVSDIPSADSLGTSVVILNIFGWLSGKFSFVPELVILSDILFFASYLTVFPMVRMQRLADAYNRTIDPSYKPVEKFYGWDIALLVLGIIITFLSFVGIFFPE